MILISENFWIVNCNAQIMLTLNRILEFLIQIFLISVRVRIGSCMCSFFFHFLIFFRLVDIITSFLFQFVLFCSVTFRFVSLVSYSEIFQLNSVYLAFNKNTNESVQVFKWGTKEDKTKIVRFQCSVFIPVPMKSRSHDTTNTETIKYTHSNIRKI